MRLINFKPTLILAAITLMAGAVIFPAITATSVAAAGADDGDGCRKVQARLTSMSVTEGCTSPFGCFAGSISGSGLLNGTFTAVVFGVAPSAGLPELEPVTKVSVSGERVITTKSWTLTLHTLTAFDTATGEFDELNQVIGGTGQFAGATGTLHLFGGATNAELTSFEGNISGAICLADED